MTATSDARWRAVGRWAFDGALTLVLMSVAISLMTEVAEGLGVARGLAQGLAAAHALPVLFRRSWPLHVLYASLVAAWGTVIVGLPTYRLGPVALVLLFTAAAKRDRRASLGGLAAVLVTLWAGAVVTSSGQVGPIIEFSAFSVGAWWLGDEVRRRQRAADLHAQRAAELQDAREELARTAVAAERLRIARELHDVVAHGLSVIAVHAGTGRLAARRDPEAAEEALQVIERASRETLADMRDLLGVLREDDEVGGRAPTPGLSSLSDLTDRVRAAGLDVDLRVTGDADAVPPGVQASAYRIVQEALTNVIKHADARRVTIDLTVDDDAVSVEVADDGLVTAAASTGHGTIGMRERVAVYGGEFASGPGSHGGWQVRARLPHRRST